MIWNDSGFLLSKIKYNENSIIAEFYTKTHGKCSGIIFGATSKKIKNYLEIGNKFHIQYSHKNDGKVGYFKIEILDALTPLYFDNKQKLLCLSSALYLVKLLTVESQENSKIFSLIDYFFEMLNDEQWLKLYIFWELELFKLIGYDLEINKIANKEIINNEIFYYVKGGNEKKNIPAFLIDRSKNDIDTGNLLKGLKLVGDYLEKTILRPNNINYPSSRIEFLNVIK